MPPPPPHLVNPRAWHKHSFALYGKFLGVGTLELPCPTAERKKEGKCPVHSQHCSTFHWSYSRVVELMSVLFWLTSAFDSTIIKTSWAMIPLHHILIFVLLRYLFQTVKYYEKVNITDRSMIVKLLTQTILILECKLTWSTPSLKQSVSILKQDCG